MKRAAIYVRVSKKIQTTEQQLEPLVANAKARGWNIVQVFKDVRTGSDDSRPELAAMMNMVHKRQIDVVLIWKLDRLGRSLRHLSQTVSEMTASGVGLYSFTDGIDMTTPAGRMLFGVLAAMAEFERDLICERTAIAIEKRRARKGGHWGRRCLIDRPKALRLLEAGKSYQSVATEIGCSKSRIALLKKSGR